MRHAASRTMAVGGATSAGGIRRLRLPTPFRLGWVNGYLIEDDPLTLVDTGPSWTPSLEALERLLGEHGHALGDLGLILVTHQHVDHAGLVDALARRSGAEVACLDLLAGFLENLDEASRANDEYVEAAMRRHGVDPAVLVALRDSAAVWRRLGVAVRVDRRLPDGATISLRDRTLRVLHRPGHSPSDTVFYDESSGVAIGGDHLLAGQPSTALVARPLDGVEPPTTPIVRYRRSLRATRALDAGVVLTGHGDPVHDPGDLIDSRLRKHDGHAERVLGMLRAGPRTANELAIELFGDRARERPYVYVCEVLNSAELLVARGRARVERGEEGCVRFAA